MRESYLLLKLAVNKKNTNLRDLVIGNIITDETVKNYGLREIWNTGKGPVYKNGSYVLFTKYMNGVAAGSPEITHKFYPRETPGGIRPCELPGYEGVNKYSSALATR